MPIYIYKCRHCGEEFEDFRNIKEREETGACIACGSGDIQRLEDVTPECGCGCGCEVHTAHGTDRDQ